jgi:Zn-finger nucleic acid-binding protein
MKCPNCDEVLIMAEPQGVEIDYCPKCRGVWLDKGEPDKIIEKSAADEAKYNCLQEERYAENQGTTRLLRGPRP